MKKAIFIYTLVTFVIFVLSTSAFGQEMSLTDQKKKLKEMEQVLDNLKKIDKTKLSSEMKEKQILSEKKLEEKIKQLKLQLAKEEKRIKTQKERIKVQQNKDAKYLTSTRPLLIKYTEALKLLHLMIYDKTQQRRTYDLRLREAESSMKDIKNKLLYLPSPFPRRLKDFHTLFVEAVDSALIYLGKEGEYKRVEDSIDDARERKEQMRRKAAASKYYKEDYILMAQEAEAFEEKQTDYLSELTTACLSTLEDCKRKNYKIVEQSKKYYEIKVPLLYESATEAQLALGFFYHNKEQYNKAMVEYKRALVLSPNSARVYSCIAKAYFDMGKLDLAIEKIKKAIQLTTEPEGLFLVLDKNQLEELRILQKVSNYYHKGMYKETVNEAEKAIKKFPGSAIPYLFVILSYLSQNKFDKAVPVIGQMLVRDPWLEINVEQIKKFSLLGGKLGVALNSLKVSKEDLKQACAKLDDVKKEKLDYGIAYRVMESILQDKEVEDIDYHQLLSLFTEEEVRESPLLCLAKGILYEKEGDKGRALRSLEKASSLDPSGKIGELAREKIQEIKEPFKGKTIFDLEESEE
ncbi:MAG TPA: tetratricopeptide repeat protein [Candidatus Glassbacteria bacterium]|nr:tetratricopeptide repeat protein [Candidatus Glassbacteria bacterium]